MRGGKQDFPSKHVKRITPAIAVLIANIAILRLGQSVRDFFPCSKIIQDFIFPVPACFYQVCPNIQLFLWYGTSPRGRRGRGGRRGGRDLDLNIYVLERETLIKLVKDATSRGLIYFERDILAHNVNILNIHALEYTGYVAHVCDMKSYFDQNLKLIDEKNLNALFPKESPVYTKIRDDNPVRYVNGSSVSNSLLADGCVIEGTVENCVLFRGVKVKKGAVVRNCVLMQDTVVEPNVELDCVVTDKNVKITAGKKLSGTESFPVYVQKNHTV